MSIGDYELRCFDWTPDQIRKRISNKRVDSIPVEARMYVYAEAQRLYFEEMMTCSKVAEKLGLAPSTVVNWVDSKADPTTSLNVLPLHPTKDLANLFGILTVAGTVKGYPGRKKPVWNVSVRAVDKRVADIVKSCFEHVFGKEVHLEQAEWMSPNGGYRVEINSRHFVEFWTGYWDVGGHLERNEYWKAIDKFPHHFLAGVFDVSGGYGMTGKSKFIILKRIGNYRKSSGCLDIVSDKLKDIGIGHMLRDNVLQISKIASIQKFLELVPLENDRWRENLPKTKSQGEWIKEEDDFVRENWKNMSDEKIGELIGRTARAVKHRRNAVLGLHRRDEPWSNEEEKFLEESYGGMETRKISEALDRSPKAVRRKAHELGLSYHGSKLDERERLYGEGKSDREIAEIQGVTPNAISEWRRQRGLESKGPGSSQKEFTNGEFIGLYREDLNDAEIEERLGVTPSAIKRRRDKLELESNGSQGGQLAFTDEEYIELYKKGLNDYEAAEKLGVTQTSVWERRQKLDLEPN